MIVALRITNRNVRGVIQLARPLSIASARGMRDVWAMQLGNGWSVAMIDDTGREAP